MSIDPLAEDYSYQSPYNFAENKVISHIELEGLEGLHHTLVGKAGNTSHLIEKNVVFLRQRPKEIPASSSPKQAERIMNNNAKIANREFDRISEIKNELKEFYGGEYKNSAKESVKFQFNFSEVLVDNTEGTALLNDNVSLYQLAAQNGLEGSLNGNVSTVPAAVFTTDSNIGNRKGLTVGAKVFGKSVDAPVGTWAHEILHTLGVPDNGSTKGGLLNSPPQSLNTNELDAVIRKSHEAK